MDEHVQGLWNLFLPHSNARAGRPVQPRVRAAVRDHGPRALVPPRCSTARRPTPATWRRSSATPPSLKAQWLDPLLRGEIRSAFLMTEPAVASSDATNIQLRIRRDGDHYVINGRKWWSSGAGDPRCAVLHRHGQDRSRRRPPPAAVDDRRAADTPGITIVRALSVFGYDDAPHGTWRSIARRRPRAGAANILLGEGPRLRDRPGPARAGPHPPLHAQRSAWPSARSS
jgi:acyl-CoA dehydrogenase